MLTLSPSAIVKALILYYFTKIIKGTIDMLTNRPVIAISFGAIAGALSRHYITTFVKEIMGKDAGFIATFWINVVGCLLIAYILTLATEGKYLISSEVRSMTTTGFCGSFTTFSTYGLEMQTFITKGNTSMLLLYGLGSAIFGMIGVQLGVALARLKTM